MIAAINMLWLGVGIAALVVVVLLIIVLVRSRDKDERLMAAAPADRPARPAPSPPGAAAPSVAAAPPTSPRPITTPAAAGSFLDEPLARDFEGLGKPVVPAAAAASSGPFPVDPFGSHEDIFPPETPAAGQPPAVAPEPTAAAPRPAAPDVAATATPPIAATPAPEATLPPEPAVPDMPPALAPAPASLSDVIVTSSNEEVDLADPDVRALLVSLVDDEIALAKQCRVQGQALDAIIQLTEAEKTCTALGLDDRLAEVKVLLAELQG